MQACRQIGSKRQGGGNAQSETTTKVDEGESRTPTKGNLAQEGRGRLAGIAASASSEASESRGVLAASSDEPRGISTDESF